MKGVDISSYQTNVDFKKVKASGIDFAIIRAGFGNADAYPNQKDSLFESHYKNAMSAGLEVGAYWYGYATDVASAIKEAQSFLNVIKGKKFSMGLWYDVEDATMPKNKATLTEIVKAFCAYVQSQKNYCGFYTNLNWAENRLDMHALKSFAFWLAQWNHSVTYSGNYTMWQNSNSGSVNGIDGKVDTDVCNVDIPTAIKATGLCGYATPPSNHEAELVACIKEFIEKTKQYL